MYVCGRRNKLYVHAYVRTYVSSTILFHRYLNQSWILSEHTYIHTYVDHPTKFCRKALCLQTPLSVILHWSEIASYIHRMLQLDKVKHLEFIPDVKVYDLWPESNNMPLHKTATLQQCGKQAISSYQNTNHIIVLWIMKKQRNKTKQSFIDTHTKSRSG